MRRREPRLDERKRENNPVPSESQTDGVFSLTLSHLDGQMSALIKFYGMEALAPRSLVRP